jgi:S-adenosylmethionine hydrolase
VTRPIVLCTDYGLTDEFVGTCHGVIARIAPDARVIDLTHAVPRQDVLRGATTLARAVNYLPTDAVCCGIVDPGVGSDRAAIAAATAVGALLVGPDNGLLSMAWEVLGGVTEAARIEADDVILRPVSATFHGRDIFAPAAAHLANGRAVTDLGSPLDPGSLQTLSAPAPMFTPGAIGARVTGIDGFGNVQLNVRLGDLEAAGLGDPLRVGTREVPRADIFAAVPVGSPAAIVDSQGFLALVVNRGSAAQLLGVREGSTVILE